MFLIAGSVALALVAAPPATAEKDDPIICKRQAEKSLGSNMRAPSRCMRKSEWDAQRRQAQRELKDINERGNNPTPIPSR